MKSLSKFAIASFIFLTVISAVSYSQVIKARATSLSIATKLSNNQWGEWSDWQECDVLVTIDLNKLRITIYSQETQIYDIATNEGMTSDEDGDETLSLYCVDKNGGNCRIRLVKLNSQGGQEQLYVDYNDARWCYNLREID